MFKKIISFLLIFVLCFSVNSYAFSFPSPDWGELYKEKQQMVLNEELELYVEAPIDEAPYYGEELEPRGGAYIGTVPEDTRHLLLPVSSFLTNIDNMNQDDLYYPTNVLVESNNVVTMAGWTINDLGKVDYNHIRRTLDNLSKYNKPIFIRFANEMNVSPIGDNPQLYIEIFRNVANMVHEYPNFAVVWSPNDLGALDRPFEYYYPGDEYVDWIGVSNYMVKYFQGKKNTQYKDTIYFMTGDYSWATNKIKPIMDFIEKNNIKKPVMISEGGVSTSNSYGENNEDWATPRLRNMLWYLAMKYPQIKMINYFDVHRANEVEKFNISDYQYAIDIFNEAKNCGAYIKEFGQNSDFVFKKAYDAPMMEAKDGVVSLYSFVYVPNQPNLTVNYRIDDVWYHMSNEIPYKCNLDLNSISDGWHTLEISTLNYKKAYSFYKMENYIEFGNDDSTVYNVQSAATDIKVYVNGKKIKFETSPVIEDGRTLVPLRAIFEALGAEVSWNSITNTVTSKKGDTTVKLIIGDDTLYVNEKSLKLDVKAKIINSRTFVPLRAVSEAFNLNVEWDGNTKSVYITE